MPVVCPGPAPDLFPRSMPRFLETRRRERTHEIENMSLLATLDGDRGEALGLGLGPGLEVGASVLEGAAEAVLRGDALDPVGRVEVLDNRDLVARGTALARDDGGVGKEELPDLRRVSFSPTRRECSDLRGTISCRTWPRPWCGWPSSCGTSATGSQSSAHQWCRRP